MGDRECRAIPECAGWEVEAALERNDPEELSIVVLSVALHADDAQSAQDLCIRLASHADANVRGNAIEGLAHVARLHGVLEEARARPVVEAALKDPEDWVRGAAEHARDDLEVFLKWVFQD